MNVVGFQWGSSGILVGPCGGSQVLAENVQGFAWDSYGAFEISKRPLQKRSRSHLTYDTTYGPMVNK